MRYQYVDKGHVSGLRRLAPVRGDNGIHAQHANRVGDPPGVVRLIGGLAKGARAKFGKASPRKREKGARRPL